MRRHTLLRAAPALAGALAAGLLGACSDLSPTNIENPNLTDEQFIGTTGAAAAWALGTQRQFLQTLNAMVQQSEMNRAALDLAAKIQGRGSGVVSK